MISPNQGAPEQRPVLSKVEARQGVTGNNVRYVLWFGLPVLSPPLPPFICFISFEPAATNCLLQTIWFLIGKVRGVWCRDAKSEQKQARKMSRCQIGAKASPQDV